MPRLKDAPSSNMHVDAPVESPAAEASREAPLATGPKKAKKARKDGKPIVGSEALRNLRNDVFPMCYQKHQG